MKKLILFLFSILLFSCGESNEQAEISATDSMSAAIDSARANDTLLMKLKKDTSL